MPSDPLKIQISLQDQHHGAMPHVRAAAHAAGGPLRGLAHTPIGAEDMLARSMEGIAGAGRGIGQGIPFLGIGLTLPAAGLDLAAGGSRRLDEMAERYGKYSPEIALAKAEADVKQVMFELAQAKEHGPKLAEWVRAQSDLTRTFEGTQTRTLLEGAPRLLDAMEHYADVIANMDVTHPASSLGKMFPGLAKIVDAFEKFDLEHPIDSLMRFFNIGGELFRDEAFKRLFRMLKKDDKAIDIFHAFKPPDNSRNLVVNKAEDWMATHPQLELADIDMPINAVILKAVGNPAVQNERDFSP